MLTTNLFDATCCIPIHAKLHVALVPLSQHIIITS